MKPILSILLSISTLISYSQEAYTVEQAKKYALEHNFRAVNALLNQQVAEQTIKETRAMGLPQVNGTVDFQNFIDIPTQVAPADAFGFPDYITDYLVTTSQLVGIPIDFPDPETQPEFTELQFGTKYNTSAGVSVNQLIFDGTYFYGLKAAKEYRKMSAMQYQQTKEELERAVEKSYYMVLIAEENVELINKNLALIEKIYKETEAFFRQGFLEEQSVEQIQLNKLSILNRLSAAEDQLKLSKQALKFQMGLPSKEDLSLGDKLESLTNQKVITDLSYGFNADKLTEYKLLDNQKDLLTLQKKADKAAAYPKLYGFFNHSQNSFSNTFGYKNVNWYPTTLWGVQLQVPLFSGLQLPVAMKKANLELQRVDELKAFTEQRLNLEFDQALIALNAAQKELELAKKSVSLSTRIEEKTSVKFKEGMVSSIELTNTQTQTLNAQGMYISALMNLLNAKVDIQKFNL